MEYRQASEELRAKVGTGTLSMELSHKPYHQVVEDVVRSTSVCRNDFDHKILLILDALHERGRVEEACNHIKKVVAQLPRSHCTHWRGYLHKLLRDFDDDTYHSVKGNLAAAYAERLPWIHEPCDHEHLRPVAADFHPGHLGWIGAVGPEDFAAVAAHKLHKDAHPFGPGQAEWAGSSKCQEHAHEGQIREHEAWHMQADQRQKEVQEAIQEEAGKEAKEKPDETVTEAPASKISEKVKEGLKAAAVAVNPGTGGA
eukprot:TRINITY_DN99334_c0_g1_i1.p1 TRINITY_DN99334_c0_g1~~TRINITY_DN99334_c0_g1_i1.p1  ORF type:complete len:256 (-),score=59.20 TRINITY_DN99334_c0_g1_i1:237-1004(-)